jgi:flagellar protein FliO/FliZ
MTWMVIRLILSLAFVGGVLLFAARLAKKRGLGQNNGLIEVVARQRMGRTSTVNVIRVGDVVLVVGATEEHVTLLAEVDAETVEQALEERRPPVRRPVPHPDDAAYEGAPAHAGRGAHASQGALAGSVFDRRGWGTFVQELRERTVRRS